jgi:acyl dehydratase
MTGLGAGRPPLDTAGEFAHTIGPIVAGYFIAHYWSLLVIVGQQAVIQLSDPLGTGANWLGTGGRAADPLLAGATTTAVIQVSAVVVGHVLGVVLAHDRAVALLPRRHAVLGQIPLLVLMVAYTVTGLVLLFAA